MKLILLLALSCGMAVGQPPVKQAEPPKSEIDWTTAIVTTDSTPRIEWKERMDGKVYRAEFVDESNTWRCYVTSYTPQGNPLRSPTSFTVTCVDATVNPTIPPPAKEPAK